MSLKEMLVCNFPENKKGVCTADFNYGSLNNDSELLKVHLNAFQFKFFFIFLLQALKKSVCCIFSVHVWVSHLTYNNFTHQVLYQGFSLALDLAILVELGLWWELKLCLEDV